MWASTMAHRLDQASCKQLVMNFENLLARNKECFYSSIQPTSWQPTCALYRHSSSFVDADLTASSPSMKNKNDRRNKKKRKSTSGKPSYRFVDQARIRVTGGNGGKGSLSMHSIHRGHKLKPDGGNGGNGGNVFLIADPKKQTLGWSHPHVVAEHGGHGSSQEKFGRNGKNTILRVPCGVIVKRVLNYDETWDSENKIVTKKEIFPMVQDDPDGSFSFSEMHDCVDFNRTKSEVDFNDESSEVDFNKAMDSYDADDSIPTEQEINDDVSSAGEFYQLPEREKVVLADLDHPGGHILVARGGRGGIGTSVSARNHGGPPDLGFMVDRAKPTEGEVAFLELELKLIADIGLVGFPNAGKSSLLTAMSRAAPEIAPYPFTTLHPFVGVLEYGDGYRIRVADVPGLIDGASQGRGKGHDFLKHLERTKALLYIVDAAGVDGRDPIRDLQILAKEISSYGNGDMMNRLAMIVANKMDLLSKSKQSAMLSDLDNTAKEIGINVHGDVLGISAGVTGYGLPQLSRAMRHVVSKRNAKRTVSEQ